ncbi:MAG: N-acetylmuramoyl-L-alanine amidase [Opitutus sp.]|nr:N-acetylmuramoyl-L-alanine amidase [Opitutus sp.]
MVRRRITLVLLSALIAGTLSAASADTLVEPLKIEKRLIHVRDPLPENPCFRPYAEQRQINVIVLHHTSAVYWFDPAFQALLTQEVKDRVHTQGITLENIQTHRFDLDLIIQIFRTYGVAPHYLIGRKGEVIQLVEDNDMAYHAGVSTMPDGDGRTGVNYFSIGIELTSVHPDERTHRHASRASLHRSPIPRPDEARGATHDPILHQENRRARRDCTMTVKKTPARSSTGHAFEDQ